tara:strand:- start:272 stop:652 length:381 start_codon:yes stop_codon:yes gene_type:complete
MIMGSPFKQKFLNKSPITPGKKLHNASSIIDPKYPSSKQEYATKANKKNKDFFQSLPKYENRKIPTGGVNEVNELAFLGGGGARVGFNLAKRAPSLISKAFKRSKTVAINLADNIAAGAANYYNNK